MRATNIHRGIGFASFIEITNPAPAFYGVGGARISSQDGVTVRLEPGGSLHVATSLTEQGQGSEAITAQVVASAFGVPLERVRVTLGDTDATPYGGGHLGLARRRHRRRSRLAGRQGLARQRARRRGRHASGESRRSRHRERPCRRCRHAHGPHQSRGGGRASPITGPTHCRPASRPSSSRPAITCRAHGPSPSPTACRPPGSKSIATPVSSNCCAIGASRIAARSSIRCSSTSRSAAASCKASAPPSSSTAATMRAGNC